LYGAYLGRQSSILARQNIKTEPCRWWNTIILSIGNDPQQFGGAIAALGRDDAELSHMPSDRIR
jgi:hypothetical protein